MEPALTAPAARARPWSLGLAIAGALALGGLVFRNMDLLGDAFWYIASGRWLLEHRTLPRADPFSYASAPGSWIIGMPGSCVLFALVGDHLGLRALQWMGTIVETVALVLLWLGSARRASARFVLLWFALYIVQVGAEDLSVRGQVFGDLGFVLLLGGLRRLRDGRRVHPALVVLVAALWANLHYSFLLLYFVPIGAALLLFLEPRETRPALRAFLAVPPLAVLGSLLNPYGWRYLPFAFRMLFTHVADDFDFYRSPDFHGLLALAGPVAGMAIVVLRGALGRRRCRVPEQLFLLVFLVATCNSRRWEPLLGAVAMGILGPLLDRARDLAWPPPDRRLPIVAGVTAALGVALAAHGFTNAPGPLQNVPVAAAAVARAAQRAKQSAGLAMDQVVDPLHWGGYLAYAWNGDPKYFHDGRDQVLLFANGTYDDAKSLRAGSPESGELLDVYEAGVVLWERGSPLDALLSASSRWHLVHADGIAVVYVRND